MMQAVDQPKMEAEILLRYASGKNAARLIVDADELCDRDITQYFKRLIKQRLAGEPVAYLTGEREFWSLSLKITDDVLIPRPETECLVEQGLACIATLESPDIVDLGCGSGAIAIALAGERPDARIVATDYSQAALALAGENADRLGAGRIEFIHSNWYQALDGRVFDLIVANPPYVAESDPHLEQGDLRFEPQQALIAANNGLSDLQVIIGHAGKHLKSAGCLIVEHGFDQGESVRQYFAENDFDSIRTLQDYAQVDRLTIGSR